MRVFKSGGETYFIPALYATHANQMNLASILSASHGKSIILSIRILSDGVAINGDEERSLGILSYSVYSAHSTL
jgi:hypothetical protein